jgi:hypothetical protein
MSRLRNEAAVTTTRVEDGALGRSTPEVEHLELTEIVGRLTVRERAELRKRLVKLWQGVDRSTLPRGRAKPFAVIDEA